MNQDRIEGNWKEFRGKVKEKWGRLTDDEIDVIEGKRDQLSGQIQKAYGVGKDEADRQIQEWEREVSQSQSQSPSQQSPSQPSSRDTGRTGAPGRHS